MRIVRSVSLDIGVVEAAQRAAGRRDVTFSRLVEEVLAEALHVVVSKGNVKAKERRGPKLAELEEYAEQVRTRTHV